MGVNGVRVHIKDIELKEGEDFTLKTENGLEIFIQLTNGELFFCNETPPDHTGGWTSITAKHDGKWESAD